MKRNVENNTMDVISEALTETFAGLGLTLQDVLDAVGKANEGTDKERQRSSRFVAAGIVPGTANLSVKVNGKRVHKPHEAVLTLGFRPISGGAQAENQRLRALLAANGIDPDTI